jgi:CheY-like chemotaxis protein
MPGGHAITIVVADDDEDDRFLTREALCEARQDTDVRCVEDGVELLRYLYRDDSPRPSLILLDLNMPRMNGHEALTRIKQDPELRSIPVVVYTTSKDEQDIAASYDRGANSYIAKPAGHQSISEIMKGISQYWREIVDLPPVALSG